MIHIQIFFRCFYENHLIPFQYYTLPDELKGLKVYSVSTGAGTYVKVAILDGQINSTTYSVDKVEESTIILNKQNGQIIEVSQVIMENDSLVVCRKLTRSI